MRLPPLVSVIVPAYRATTYIAETMDSVLSQTFQDFEIIVVNDGCPDTVAFEAALAPYRSRIVYLKQENQGPAVARNTAISRSANTKYIALLDADDKWEPSYLEVQTAAMESDPTIDVLYCDAILFGQTSERSRTFMSLSPSRGEVTFESLVIQECNVMVSVLARREAIVRAGMFDKAFCGNEDFDLWLRIVKAGGRIAYHRRALVRYRQHPDSLSANRLRMCKGFIEVMQKLLRRSDLSEAERILILGRVDYTEAIMAWEEGMNAIQTGDSTKAYQRLRCANRVLRNPRLSLLIAALRIFPWGAIPVSRVRRRISGVR